jgi:hypothetical protein
MPTDTERMEWLEANRADVRMNSLGRPRIVWGERGELTTERFPTLRAAIDAAMGEERKE